MGHEPRNKTGTKSVVEVRFKNGSVDEVPCALTQPELGKRKRHMKCWATLLAHMSGFAAICSGASMQQLETFKTSPIMVFLPAILNQAFLVVVFYAFSVVRARKIKEAAAKGRAGLRAKMCHEEVTEAENDISSLALSFLITQAIRFAVSGQRPNEEGLEEPEVKHGYNCVFILYGIGISLALSSGIWIAIDSALKPKEEPKKEKKEGEGGEGGEEEEEESVAVRFCEIMMNTSGMLFAWCTMWATRWAFVMSPTLHKIDCKFPSTMARVTLAITLSFFVVLVIIVIDRFDDWMRAAKVNAKNVKKMVQVVINALGILAGFSWEHAFDGGVEAIASTTPDPMTCELAFGFLVAAFIIRPWRRHILTKSMSLIEMSKGMDREEDE